MTKKKEYKRILLKLSGEALMGAQQAGHHPETIYEFCKQIKEVYELGYQICIVVGGGNICRGAVAAKMGIERATADYMGMLATVINALAVQSVLESVDISTRVQSAIRMTEVCEQYIRRKAIRHMEKSRIVIFAAGTGNPFFTTDTAAALRAIEMDCDVILKGTQVDGIYSADPHLDKTAVRYKTISYKKVIERDLAVMDTAAITLARDNNIPIIVFDIHQESGLKNALQNSHTFTVISNEDTEEYH